MFLNFIFPNILKQLKIDKFSEKREKKIKLLLPVVSN